MYIQCSTVTRKGKVSRNRKLVTSYRDPKTKQPRTRTIRTIEKLPLLERSRLLYQYKGFKHMTPEEWLALEQAGDFRSEAHEEVFVGDCYKGGGTAVGWHHLKTSGLYKVLHANLGRKAARVIQELVLHQLIRPESKLQFTDHRKTCLVYALEGKEEFGKDTVYRSMDELADQFESVRQGLNELLPASDSRRLKYDLSNSYFCGNQAELGGYGESKEKRHDRYIVTYGLVVNENDMPLDIRVWKGGTAETKTVKETFKDWKARYNAEEATWIADRGMSGVESVEIIRDLGLNYITGIPGQTQKSLLMKMVETNPGLFDDPGLGNMDFGGKRYVICKHFEKGYRNERQNYAKRRKVYTELKAIQNSPQNKNEKKLYHRAMRALEKYGQAEIWEIAIKPLPLADQKTDKKKSSRPQQRYRLDFRLNRERAKNLDRIGHFYLLQTDHSSERMAADEVRDAYKSLMAVERCFRYVKSDIDLRPIRHRLSRRIKAHIYLCFLSLWICRHIENEWRKRGINVEVPLKLAQWDNKIQYCETLDEEGRVFGIKWNRGNNAMEAYQEIVAFGENAAIKELR